MFDGCFLTHCFSLFLNSSRESFDTAATTGGASVAPELVVAVAADTRDGAAVVTPLVEVGKVGCWNILCSGERLEGSASLVGDVFETGSADEAEDTGTP